MSRLRTAALCFAIGLLASLLASCSEGPEDAPGYLQKAQEQRKANRNDLAMVELRNALKLAPDLLPALELQLELLEEEQNIGEVFSLTEPILEVNPDHLDANLRRGELLLLSGDFQASTDYVDRALKLAPDSIKALNLKTAQLIRARDLSEAQTLSDRVLTNDNHNATSFTLAGAIRLIEDNYEATEEVLQRGLAIYPQDMALHQLSIQLAARQSQFNKIPAIYQQLIEYHPQNLSIHQNFAIFLVQNDEQDRAIQVMRDAAEKIPDNLDAKLLLAQLIAGTGNDSAADLIRELVVAEPDAGQLRFLLASVYRDAQRYAEAAEQYEAISEHHKDDPIALQARAELARQALAQGRPEEASALLDSVLQVNSEHPTALLIGAHRHILEDEPDKAISALNIILRNQPDDDAALTLMGRSYLNKKYPDLARESFVTALQANPKNALAAKHLAIIYLQDEKYSNMVDVLKGFELLSTADTALLGLLLQARIQLKDWPAAERLTTHPAMLAAHPKLTDWVQAMAMQDAGDFDQSILRLRQITEADPTRNGPARTLVTVYMQTQQSAEAIAYLKSVIAAHPKLNWPGQLLVQVYLQSGKTNQAAQFLGDAINKKQASPYHYAYLAGLEHKEEGIEQALLTIQTGIEAYPESAPLNLSYASMLEQAGNTTLDRAYEIAKRFSDSSQPYFVDTLGWICALRNDLDCALPLLQKVVKQVPDQPEFNYHLGNAYQRAKQNETAKRYLLRSQQLIDEGKTFPGSDNVKVLLEAELSENG